MGQSVQSVLASTFVFPGIGTGADRRRRIQVSISRTSCMMKDGLEEADMDAKDADAAAEEALALLPPPAWWCPLVPCWPWPCWLCC